MASAKAAAVRTMRMLLVTLERAFCMAPQGNVVKNVDVFVTGVLSKLIT